MSISNSWLIESQSNLLPFSWHDKNEPGKNLYKLPLHIIIIFPVEKKRESLSSGKNETVNVYVHTLCYDSVFPSSHERRFSINFLKSLQHSTNVLIKLVETAIYFKLREKNVRKGRNTEKRKFSRRSDRLPYFHCTQHSLDSRVDTTATND